SQLRKVSDLFTALTAARCNPASVFCMLVTNLSNFITVNFQVISNWQNNLLYRQFSDFRSFSNSPTLLPHCLSIHLWSSPHAPSPDFNHLENSVKKSFTVMSSKVQSL